MKDTAFSTETYTAAVKERLQQVVNGGGIERLYLHIGGRLIGDKHAARVLPGYQLDTKLVLIKSLADDTAYVYCVSAADLERGRVRGDTRLSYTDETCRSLTELAENGIVVHTLVIVGGDRIDSYPQLGQYASDHGIEIVLWNAGKSVLDDSFTIEQFEDNRRIEFEQHIVVVLSPGSNSGKFDFCLQQLLLEKQSGHLVTYARLQVFPVPALHPWHPVNLAYFAATADVYTNEELFTVADKDPESAWSFYQKDKKIVSLVDAINDDRQDEGVVRMETMSIEQGIVDVEIAEREGAAEIMRRYMRYSTEVAHDQERPETLGFTERLVKLVLDQYRAH